MTSTTAPTRGYRVAELADEVGVRPDTIRYYERTGLLPSPPRTSAGYRLYPPATIERVRFIQGCARLGLRLADIADLLSADAAALLICACVRRLRVSSIVRSRSRMYRLDSSRLFTENLEAELRAAIASADTNIVGDASRLQEVLHHVTKFFRAWAVNLPVVIDASPETPFEQNDLRTPFVSHLRLSYSS